MEVAEMPRVTVASNVTFIPEKRKKELVTLDNINKKRRVCGYARVSTDMEEQATSYKSQVDYYSNLIKANPEWEYVDLYSDEGISGTSTKHREGFNRMIKDALDGKIDLIITKSISRFARNTVDALVNIRKLKENNVEVYFEKENIYSLDSKGELMLSLLSSLAQEESRSISLNTAWGKRKQFADGKFAIGYKTFLGYDKGKDGKLVVNKEEAKAIKLIFKLFLMGYSLYAIKKELERKKIKTPMGKNSWHLSTIKSELTNEKYKGDALLQKNYTSDFLTKKQKKNDGELPKYYVTDDHEAIIDKATFDYVQIELKKRIKANSEVHGNRITSRYSGVSIFSGKIVCGECGSYFGKKVWHSNDKYKKFVYRCNHKYGDTKCDSGYITEDDVKNMFIIELSKLNKSETIKNALIIKDTLCDTSKLKAELEKTNKALETLVHKNEMLILENSTKAIDQEEHKRKREEIGAAYKEMNAKCEKITSEIKDKENRALLIDGFIKNLKSVKKLVDFDEELFCALVEKVVVYKDRAEIVWKGQE